MTKVILNSLQPKLLNWGRAGLWTATFLLCFSSVALAAQEKPKPEEFKVNPLEITKPDPLLPRLPKRGTLTPEQQSSLRTAIDELDAQGLALYKEKKADEAFEVWYRGLRLRRALERVEEVQALGRVGEIAWQNNRKFDAQVITKRLQEIHKEAEDKKALNLELLQALGQAYQQVRFPEPAVKVYQQILAQERQQGDTEAQEATLKTLAQLNMDWFNYPQAAAVYEDLLTQAQARGDRVNELAYLEQLVYIYNKAQQPENALRMKQKLAATYPPTDPRLPALKIAIATEYEALNELDPASQNYQEAYKLAWALRQWAYASEALQKLAALYHAHNQSDYALQVYDVLLKTQQQSYNFYGLMNTYDKMGQIYLEQRKYSQALDVFQRGMQLAKSLQYQENYFAEQIDRVSKQSSPQ
jgi:tetratricopeptide (TPR) repeat protein